MTTHRRAEQGRPGHGQHGGDPDEAATALAEMLDLDGEVLRDHLSDVTAELAELAGDPAPERLLDLGGGTGTGTFALLRRFPRADVTAVDGSAPMLAHLRARAAELGVLERVRTVQADLDASWPALGPVDLVWAAASLHHLADPDAGLAAVHAVLRPGGLLAVLELDSFPRFLPHDLALGRPGLEDRLHAALNDVHAREVPHLGDDWGARLSSAGFVVERERTVDVRLAPPPSAAVRRYARVSLGRLGAALADGGRVAADDARTLAVLLDGDGPDGIEQRRDLAVRTTRTLVVARRP